MNPSPLSYKRHRFPPEIIAHVAWLYFRFAVSLRLVEEMLLERGIVLSYVWLPITTTKPRRLRRNSRIGSRFKP